MGKSALQGAGAHALPLSLKSWHSAALELLPQKPRDRYRLRAEVRINQRSVGGVGGIYAAYAESPAPDGGTEQWWASLVFTDDSLTRKVSLELHRCRGEGPGQSARDCSMEVARGSIPKGKSGDWRRLQLEVGPSGIAAFWEGERLADLGLADLGRNLRTVLAAAEPRSANAPSAEALLRGGLGLYNQAADTWYRHVIVEPLE
jgi:hypothetical protein